MTEEESAEEINPLIAIEAARNALGDGGVSLPCRKRFFSALFRYYTEPANAWPTPFQGKIRAADADAWKAAFQQVCIYTDMIRARDRPNEAAPDGPATKEIQELIELKTSSPPRPFEERVGEFRDELPFDPLDFGTDTDAQSRRSGRDEEEEEEEEEDTEDKVPVKMTKQDWNDLWPKLREAGLGKRFTPNGQVRRAQRLGQGELDGEISSEFVIDKVDE
jgi:hypothetical protein